MKILPLKHPKGKESGIQEWAKLFPKENHTTPNKHKDYIPITRTQVNNKVMKNSIALIEGSNQHTLMFIEKIGPHVLPFEP